MNNLDIGLGLVLLFGAYRGYRNGFLMGLVSLLAIILGILGGFKLMGEGMLFLQREFNADTSVLPYVSFLLIFILIVFGVQVLGRLIKSTIDQTFLGKLDETMGAILGVIKWMFLISVILWIAHSLEVKPSEELTSGSVLYPFIVQFASLVAGWMSGFLPFFKEIFEQF